MTESLRIRRLQFVGHKWRRKEELITAKVLLWEPNHGRRKRGRLIDQLNSDIGLWIEEIKNMMEDREKFKKLMKDARVYSKLFD